MYADRAGGGAGAVLSGVCGVYVLLQYVCMMGDPEVEAGWCAVGFRARLICRMILPVCVLNEEVRIFSALTRLNSVLQSQQEIYSIDRSQDHAAM
jgi:hypothetical protein